jgi:pyridoxine 5-phosphate synthase
VVKLGVNVDHVATVRQARGTDYPSPIEAALCCAEAGAQGITIHLREDRRHIQDRDVADMKEALPIPLNLELACAEDVVDLAVRIRPEEACLVPERRQERTTEGGLDAAGSGAELADTVARLASASIRVSLFIEADPRQIEAARDIGVPAIELHTGRFCEAEGADAEEVLCALREGARLAHSIGLQVNAGHGIHLDNIGEVLRVPHLDTLNIGHSIVARAIMVGMSEAVAEMLSACASYSGGDAA